MEHLSEREMELVAALQAGLPLVSRPYAAIGAKIGMSEKAVIEHLASWQADGTIRRMGVIVRHHELGYRANAMVVWNIPDVRVQEVGRLLGEQSVVTLCYQRPRRLPDWPYNLFCMIHGQDRDVVLGHVKMLAGLLSEQCGLPDVEHNVLFSRRRFKQRGARSIEEKSVMPQQIEGIC
jgi:DNA-binding Lrp family transcriptional regulator